jgi:transcriptional regulator of acetoin/glycerol metabolism
LSYDWIDKRFKELIRHRPDATIAEGFQYAVVCLYRDIEPGVGDGVLNLYEALTSENQKALARTLGINRITIWRHIKDFRT